MFRSLAPRLLACVGLSAALMSVSSSPVQAQDPSLPATYGSLTLRSGFVPDPRVVSVFSGGGIRTNLGGVGAWVANPPDFKLYYTAGNFPLTFRVESGSDTTLLINAPDGRWYANDDADGTLNPRLTFSNPQSGRYDVWVGSFRQNGGDRANLIITELR